MSGSRWRNYLREQGNRYLQALEVPMCDTARLVRIAESPAVVNGFRRQLQQGRTAEQAAEKALVEYESGWIGPDLADQIVHDAEEIRAFARILETKE